MKIVGIIPARYDSSRLPGKPLERIGNATMIERVYRQAEKANSLSKVIVATDDSRIYETVKRFGGLVKMTDSKHKNGTERIAEVAQKVEADAIINIQGDEPFLPPEDIDKVGHLLKNKASIATLVKEIKNSKEIDSPHVVKVVRNRFHQALYFSRHGIPFQRSSREASYFKHIGIYGFQKATLLKLVELPPSPLEKSESLEQLRWLENGYDISTAETESNSLSVDTLEDLHQARKQI